MIAVFLPPYPFRGLPAPYLWVFYKFISQSSEALYFIVGDAYLDLEANAGRWEHTSDAPERLNYTIPTREELDRHQFYMLSQAPFEEQLARRNHNPVSVFKDFLTVDIPILGNELEDALNCAPDLEAIVSWSNCPTLTRVANQRDIPVIHLELGPLRSPEYRSTAYLDFTGVNGNTEARTRYEALAKDLQLDITASDLLGYYARKAGQHDDVDRNKMQLGLALQVEDDSNLVAFSNGYDNTSLINHARLLNSGIPMLVRAHPGSLFNLDNQKLIVDYSPDTACFLDRIQELIIINSSVGLEALLRGKRVKALGDSSYQFMTLLPDEQRAAALAFYLFGYLVPQELVFDLAYLRMRLGSPAEGDIIGCHIAHYAGTIGPMPTNSATLKQMIEYEIQREKLEKLAHIESELRLKITGMEQELQCLEHELVRHQELSRLHAIDTQQRDATIRELRMKISDTDEQSRQIRERLAQAEGTITEIFGSKSWRLSAPVRVAGRAVTRARRLAEAYTIARNRYVSPAQLLNKAFAVYQREGIPGLRLRVRQLLISTPSAADQSNTVHLAGRRNTEVTRLDEPVDIVVCVHNALQDVKHCLESVSRYTLSPYNLILVDDGSSPETQAYLAEYASEQGATLHRNEIAGGYTRAANCGLRLSSASYVVLLNSDTIVSPYWLERLVRCAKHAPRTGVVGPLSNTASWQSVPRIFDETGDWTDNPLPEGLSIQDFANEVAREAQAIYPEVGFINGFCFLISRNLINEIGHFDEVTFAKGYGEENDFCLRAAAAGWKLAIADDAYVFHAQSKSYSHERRKELASAAGEKLAAKHGQAAINNQLSITAPHLALEYIRQRTALIETKQDTRIRSRQFQGKRVLFVLPARTAGGGGNIILLEADRLRRLGIDAHIVNLSSNRDIFIASYPENTLPTHFVDSPEAIVELAMSFDAVVATLYLTVEWLAPLAKREGAPRIAYYVQDYEPDFFPAEHPEHARALKSYSLIPNARLVTKTQWNRRILQEKCGATASVIGIDYDDERYFPSRVSQAGNSIVRVCAMLRPQTPRRAPELTARVLKLLKTKFGSQVSIHTFGCNDNDPSYHALGLDIEHENLGECSPEAVSQLLRRTDVFLDLSSFQAMGLTALEAMACGAAVVAPRNGGPSEFIEDGENGLLVDSSDEQACLNAACSLVTDFELRNRIRNQAVGVSRFYPEAVLEKLLTAIFA